MKILIVDDHKGTRSHLRRHLEEAGHEVVEAQDGIEALHILVPYKGAEESFDAIVSDCQMPHMSGLSLLQAANHNRIRIPFLLHSSEGKFRPRGGMEVELSDITTVFNFAQFHLKAVDFTFAYVDEFLGDVS